MKREAVIRYQISCEPDKIVQYLNQLREKSKSLEEFYKEAVKEMGLLAELSEVPDIFKLYLEGVKHVILNEPQVDDARSLPLLQALARDAPVVVANTSQPTVHIQMMPPPESAVEVDDTPASNKEAASNAFQQVHDVDEASTAHFASNSKAAGLQPPPKDQKQVSQAGLAKEKKKISSIMNAVIRANKNKKLTNANRRLNHSFDNPVLLSDDDAEADVNAAVNVLHELRADDQMKKKMVQQSHDERIGTDVRNDAASKEPDDKQAAHEGVMTQQVVRNREQALADHDVDQHHKIVDEHVEEVETTDDKKKHKTGAVKTTTRRLRCDDEKKKTKILSHDTRHKSSERDVKKKKVIRLADVEEEADIERRSTRIETRACTSSYDDIKIMLNDDARRRSDAHIGKRTSSGDTRVAKSHHHAHQASSPQASASKQSYTIDRTSCSNKQQTSIEHITSYETETTIHDNHIQILIIRNNDHHYRKAMHLLKTYTVTGMSMNMWMIKHHTTRTERISSTSHITFCIGSSVICFDVNSLMQYDDVLKNVWSILDDEKMKKMTFRSGKCVDKLADVIGRCVGKHRMCCVKTTDVDVQLFTMKPLSLQGLSDISYRYLGKYMRMGAEETLPFSEVFIRNWNDLEDIRYAAHEAWVLYTIGTRYADVLKAARSSFQSKISFAMSKKPIFLLDSFVADVKQSLQFLGERVRVLKNMRLEDVIREATSEDNVVLITCDKLLLQNAHISNRIVFTSENQVFHEVQSVEDEYARLNKSSTLKSKSPRSPLISPPVKPHQHASSLIKPPAALSKDPIMVHEEGLLRIKRLDELPKLVQEEVRWLLKEKKEQGVEDVRHKQLHAKCLKCTTTNLHFLLLLHDRMKLLACTNCNTRFVTTSPLIHNSFQLYDLWMNHLHHKKLLKH